MKKKLLKAFVIWLLLTSVVTFADWGIRHYKTYRYNKTHWITVTFKDRKNYGIIKNPIVLKIHPGDKVEFPKLEDHADEFGGWLYWEGYNEEDENSFSVNENDRFYDSITIYPVYHAEDPYGGCTQGVISE